MTHLRPGVISVFSTNRGKEQRTLSITLDVILPANTNSGLVPIYVVPAEYNAHFSSMIISCDESVIQRVEIYEEAILRLSTTFDLVFPFIDSDLGIIPKPPGTVMIVRIYNNDILNARRFTGTLWGVLVPTKIYGR